MIEIRISDSPSASHWASIAALGVIWGGTFMVVSIALEGYGPLTVEAARTTLGALALLGLMIALGRSLPAHRDPYPRPTRLTPSAGAREDQDLLCPIAQEAKLAWACG